MSLDVQLNNLITNHHDLQSQLESVIALMGRVLEDDKLRNIVNYDVIQKTHIPVLTRICGEILAIRDDLYRIHSSECTLQTIFKEKKKKEIKNRKRVEELRKMRRDKKRHNLYYGGRDLPSESEESEESEDSQTLFEVDDVRPKSEVPQASWAQVIKETSKDGWAKYKEQGGKTKNDPLLGEIIDRPQGKIPVNQPIAPGFKLATNIKVIDEDESSEDEQVSNSVKEYWRGVDNTVNNALLEGKELKDIKAELIKNIPDLL